MMNYSLIPTPVAYLHPLLSLDNAIMKNQQHFYSLPQSPYGCSVTTATKCKQNVSIKQGC